MTLRFINIIFKGIAEESKCAISNLQKTGIYPYACMAKSAIRKQ